MSERSFEPGIRRVALCAAVLLLAFPLVLAGACAGEEVSDAEAEEVLEEDEGSSESGGIDSMEPIGSVLIAVGIVAVFLVAATWMMRDRRYDDYSDDDYQYSDAGRPVHGNVLESRHGIIRPSMVVRLTGRFSGARPGSVAAWMWTSLNYCMDGLKPRWYSATNAEPRTRIPAPSV